LCCLNGRERLDEKPAKKEATAISLEGGGGAKPFFAEGVKRVYRLKETSLEGGFPIQTVLSEKKATPRGEGSIYVFGGMTAKKKKGVSKKNA